MRTTRTRLLIVSVLSGVIPLCVLTAGCEEMTTANPLPLIEAGADADATDASGDVRADATSDADAALDSGRDATDPRDASDAGETSDARDAAGE